MTLSTFQTVKAFCVSRDEVTVHRYRTLPQSTVLLLVQTAKKRHWHYSVFSLFRFELGYSSSEEFNSGRWRLYLTNWVGLIALRLQRMLLTSLGRRLVLSHDTGRIFDRLKIRAFRCSIPLTLNNLRAIFVWPWKLVSVTVRYLFYLTSQ